MTKLLRIFLVSALALGTLAGGAALADVDNVGNANNVQEGDNSGDTSQSGSSTSGDSVGGQVTGVVSSGDATVDATNDSSDIDIRTGRARGDNSSGTFVGLNEGSSVNITVDVTNITAGVNVQEGDNSYTLAQAVDSSSGDGVGGQVIGGVTSAGGSAGIVADNTSTDVDIETGETVADSESATFVGLNVAAITLDADIDNIADAQNVQEGDNSLDETNTAIASSGDGVGGQVLGVVSAGDAEVDATNSTDDADLETGASDADNESAYFVGLNVGNATLNADVTNVTGAPNLQEGDNASVVAQTADAASGDAVAGQVGGVVTSAGGSADVALDNSSDDVTLESGVAVIANEQEGFIGLNVGTIILSG